MWCNMSLSQRGKKSFFSSGWRLLLFSSLLATIYTCVYVWVWLILLYSFCIYFIGSLWPFAAVCLFRFRICTLKTYSNTRIFFFVSTWFGRNYYYFFLNTSSWLCSMQQWCFLTPCVQSTRSTILSLSLSLVWLCTLANVWVWAAAVDRYVFVFLKTANEILVFRQNCKRAKRWLCVFFILWFGWSLSFMHAYKYSNDCAHTAVSRRFGVWNSPFYIHMNRVRYVYWWLALFVFGGTARRYSGFVRLAFSDRIRQSNEKCNRFGNKAIICIWNRDKRDNCGAYKIYSESCCLLMHRHNAFAYIRIFEMKQQQKTYISKNNDNKVEDGSKCCCVS